MNGVARCFDAGLSLAALGRLGGGGRTGRARKNATAEARRTDAEKVHRPPLTTNLHERPRYTDRVRGWLFNFAAAVSLVTCLAASALWARGRFFAFDRITMHVGGRDWQVWTPNGALYFRFASRPYSPPGWDTNPPLQERPFWDPLRPAGAQWHHLSGRPHNYRWLGFDLTPTYYHPGYAAGVPRYHAGVWFTAVGVPLYAVIVTSAALPAVWLRRHVRTRRRRSQGRCPTCGYDLRASPDRCPECGAEAPATAAE